MRKRLILVIVLFLAVVSINLTTNTIQERQQIKNYAQQNNLRDTFFNFTVYLHGLGNSGDSTNPTDNSFSNKAPTPTGRTITIYVYDTTMKLIKTHTDTISYNRDKGYFDGIINMGRDIPAGNYIVKVKVNGYLQRRIFTPVNVIPLTEVKLPPITLIAGDLNSDNKTDILDFNIFRGCYSDIWPAVFCTRETQRIADFSSDGIVDMLDYNLFLREVLIQKGD